MKYETAKIFSNGTGYEIFRDNYCENKCIHHKERDDGFAEFIHSGGCPIENLLEDARWDRKLFPDVLLEVWDGEKCLNWHHCPFYTAYDPDKVVEQIHEYFRKEMEAVCISAGDEIPMGEINHLMKANKNVCRIVKKGGVE